MSFKTENCKTNKQTKRDKNKWTKHKSVMYHICQPDGQLNEFLMRSCGFIQNIFNRYQQDETVSRQKRSSPFFSHHYSLLHNLWNHIYCAKITAHVKRLNIISECGSFCIDYIRSHIHIIHKSTTFIKNSSCCPTDIERI